MINENKIPVISVVMSVYNAEKYLDEAIESILNQTFKDFEFIIINDGSTDKSLEIIEKYQKEYNRIVLISRENKGLIYSLNEGIEKARGEYIARMDADDISLPNRFEEQVELLSKNSKIDVVGCNYQLIDEKSNIKGDVVKVPMTNEDILMNLCYTVPFAHPSVMIRKSIFENFKYEINPTEDYLLWTKIFNGENFRNIEKLLFKYRHQYGDSFSDSKRLKMLNAEKNISRDFIYKNKQLLIETFNKNISSNYFVCRAVSNIILILGIKESVNIVKKRFFICSQKFILRHFIRWLYWRLKS